MSGFTFDRSDRSVVVVCGDCGARDLAAPGAEWAAAHAHERRAHPGATQASRGLSEQTRRRRG